MSDLLKPSVVPEDAAEKGDGFHKHGDRGHYHPFSVEDPHVHGIAAAEEERAEEAPLPPIPAPAELRSQMVTKLADALGDEFNFFEASQESWEIAAEGILTKMRAEVTWGGPGLVVVQIPMAN